MLLPVSRAEWQEITLRLEAKCAGAGLDLVHAFDVGRYNAVAPPGGQLHDFGAAGRLGILIGNTRKLWAPFVAALQSDAALGKSENPLDSYVTEKIARFAEQATLHRH